MRFTIKQNSVTISYKVIYLNGIFFIKNADEYCPIKIAMAYHKLIQQLSRKEMLIIVKLHTIKPILENDLYSKKGLQH